VTASLLLVFLVAIGPLALFFGTDSRLPDDRRSF
jgi:hypothetical protein